MNFIKNIESAERLHQLIMEEKTGTPKVLAQKLGIPRNLLYLLIDELHTLNMPVAYSRKYETFYYEPEVKLRLLQKRIQSVTA